MSKLPRDPQKESNIKSAYRQVLSAQETNQPQWFVRSLRQAVKELLKEYKEWRENAKKVKVFQPTTDKQYITIEEVKSDESN